MKIAIRGGHTKATPGASVIIDELNADRLVLDATKKYLIMGGATVYDVTPPSTMPYPQELNYGISKANNLDVDLFVSIHFNNVYNKKYSSAIGTEVWVYNKSFGEASRTVDNLASLGFKNRGVKSMVNEGRTLGELKNTKMKAMIVEVCFVESIVDYEVFKTKGVDLIGKKIAEGILNKSITTTDKKYRIICSGMSEARAIEACERLRKEPRGFKCRYEEQ